MIPNLAALKHQGRVLHKEMRVTDPKATYTSALHALARTYGLPNWQTLRTKANPAGPKLFMEEGFPCIRQRIGKNDISLVWEDIGEGENGDYDEEDPDDQPLLRLTVYNNPPKGDREELPSSSYCTQMPTTTSQVVLIDALYFCWQVLEKELERKDPQPKRICQTLSWIGQHKHKWDDVLKNAASLW